MSYRRKHEAPAEEYPLDFFVSARTAGDTVDLNHPVWDVDTHR